ncbi:MAG: hypothetical protein A2W05_01740 [Candidatus Schekmanbacteria bacterium RBG_16_38_10]|uniref:NodB homology domain-containing protein n=1 Tax=Candidatus Schekmanbacteria bacterium RBG_16_38_10 TaxID=1817879 RepID=A0A1F7RPD6_9BACT|nr:MAG: hypothetical protein A2W05_01740 [Candidatus Schekmanbacteria bacterium RBG_16_38_10]
MNINSFRKTILLHTLSAVPYPLLEKIVRPAVIIPYYHMISDDEVIHIKHLYRHKNIKEFTQALEFLLQNYTPLSLMELIDIITKGGALPEKAFLLTFDDGFREMSDIVAPILIEKGIPATFFINTAFIDNKEMCYQHEASILEEYLRNNCLSQEVMRKTAEILQGQSPCSKGRTPLMVMFRERELLHDIAKVVGYDFNDYLMRNKPYLTSEQIRRLLNQGFTIGAHSINHPLYSALSLEDQLYQTSKSIRDIKDRFGLKYGAFAFPHTDHGVSKEFFIEIYKTGLVDISFGTSGIMDDIFYRNMQRINFERPLLPVQNIMSFHLARRFFKNITGNGRLTRHCIVD